MKRFLFIATILCQSVFAQVSKPDFCGYKLKAPKNCLISDSIIRCDKNYVQWFYQDKYPEMVRDIIYEQMKEACLKQVNITKTVNQAFISFDHAMIGTVMIQEGEKGRRTYFWTKGKINGNDVIIYAGIAGSVTSNRDIPKFIRQVIQFNH